ncbi:MAG: recombinase RecT [Minisyncoccia bacterium]
MTDILKIQQEVTEQIADKEVMNALITTTFKGLAPAVVKSAIVEGMIRGFTFKDFLEKNVYAIKFGSGYALVTSIDNNRKIGMRSGVVGTNAPIYVMTDQKTSSNIPKPECATITVKRMVNGYVGEFTATAYFDEYYKQGSTWDGVYKPSMWDTKPRTMIAKVAEMHALRKACPEELAQSFVEEEMEREAVIQVADTPVISDEIRAKVADAKTEDELRTIWEAHKGLGKEFGRMVVEQKKFIKESVIEA